MGDYGYGIWTLAAIALIGWSWHKRWRLGWSNFYSNPTTMQDAAIDWLAWVLPVLVLALVVRNALIWLGMPVEWEAALWVMFLAYAIVRGIDYGKIAWSLRGVIATKEEMLETMSVKDILDAAKKEGN